MSYSSRSSGGGLVAVVGVVVVAAIIGFILYGSSHSTTDPGFVGIARNGGPFDNTQIRTEDGRPFTNAADPNTGVPTVLPPGSALTNVGLFSTLRQYPSTNRYWTIDPDGGDTNQAVDVQTKDGVTVGISGQFNFTQNLDPKVLGDFDNAYGSRPFGPNGLKPSDGSDASYNAFLAEFVPNTVNNSLRQEIGQINCRDLIASCSLLQNGTAPDTAPNSQGAIAQIQDAVNANFERALNAQLGGPYLTHASFNLSKVSLPPELEAAVGRARSAFAQVSEKQAQVAGAQADAAGIQSRADAYRNCPGCLAIDLQKAQGDALARLQPGAVYAPGQNLNLNVPTGK